MSDPENEKKEKYSAAHWDKLRASFQSSMLVDTRLSSLAESLDTESWPLKGKDETPAKYVDLSFDELQDAQEMQGNPERIHLLIDILEGTLAFDDPFGEMVLAEEASASEDNEVLKNLGRLQIPPEYPIRLTNLSRESRQLCENQKLGTLKEFADFSQNMAQHIVLAGDFRRLLNALIHIDEKTIASYLPFRPGSKGLHLPEAVGLLVDSIETEEQLALYNRFGGRLEPEERNLAEKVTRQRLNEMEATLAAQLRPLLDWFSKDREDLESMLNYGQALDRFFMPINNQVKETIAARLATTTLKGSPAGKPGTESGARPKTAPATQRTWSDGLREGVANLWHRIRKG